MKSNELNFYLFFDDISNIQNTGKGQKVGALWVLWKIRYLGSKQAPDQKVALPPPVWYRVKALDLYIINLFLVIFCKFVTSKSPCINQVEIKPVYMMSSEFWFKSGESMLNTLIAEGGGAVVNNRGVGISC